MVPEAGVSAVEQRVTVASALDLALLRSAVLRVAAAAGLSLAERQKLEVICTELGTNLLAHAGGGEVRLEGPAPGAGRCIRIVSLDRGPGIPDPEKAREIGYSTARTSGLGLATVGEFAHSLEILARPGGGCEVRAELWYGC